MFCDLRGYTAYVESHGDRAAADLLERYRALVRAAIARAAGAEIRTEGDGFYVVFPSASAAVRGALDITAAAADASAETPEVAIAVGVGVHAGETVEAVEGYVGSAVNIAARLGALAGPGEVLVTETVRGLVRTSVDVAFVPRGHPRLKGIAEPIAVYRVSRHSPLVAAPPRWPPVTIRGGLFGVAAVAVIAASFVVWPWIRGGTVPSPTATASSAASPGATPVASARTGTTGASSLGAPLPGRLAFVATQALGETGRSDPGSHLYVADAGGGQWQRMTQLTERVSYATWSPDGRRLAYELWSESGPPRVVDVASGPASSSMPWPSADGRIAWQGRSYAPGPLSWSVTGDVILCGGIFDQLPTTIRIFAVPPDGPTLRLVTSPDPSAQPEADDCEAAVSPDGRAIAFLSGPSVVAMGIWVAPTDGRGERAPVTHDMLVEAQHGIGVSWSPDGETLAFAGQVRKGDPIEIWTIDARGTNLRRLTSDDATDFSPAWSPDGRWIAWVRVVGEQQQVWVMAADGSGQRPLLVGAEGEQLDLVGWAPEPD